METDLQARRITIITVAAVLLGIATICLHPATAIFMPLFIIFSKIFPLVTLHSWIEVSIFFVTCFIFGLINGHSLQSISKYLRSIERNIPTFNIFILLMTIYHYFEFQMVNNFHHLKLNWDSFLIYHSYMYTIVQAFMLTEHLITYYFLQLEYKFYHPYMWIALFITITGQAIRIIAFFTCRSNFTHLVRYKKVKGHTLITNGIYSFLRHPSYTGYFYFALFSQVFLGNFVSAILFFFFLIKFFDERIEDQEKALDNFFPEYKEYQKQSYILIPFVRTPNLEQESRTD